MRLVHELGVITADQLDCTLEEWKERFGWDTLRAARIPIPTIDEMVELLDKPRRRHWDQFGPGGLGVIGS